MGRYPTQIRRVDPVDKEFATKILDSFLKFDRSGKIFLFGSRAKNTHSLYSDYDLLFLSDQFGPWNESQRHFFILNEIRPTNSKFTMEPHSFTFDEWASRKGTLFYLEVVNYGRELGEFL